MSATKRIDDDKESEIFLQRCLNAPHRKAAKAAGVSTRTYYKRTFDPRMVELFRRLLARKRIVVLPPSKAEPEICDLK